MRKRERVSLWIACALCAGVLVAMCWRIERGIDFTDDSFYLALPLRIVLGDQPFVDEFNIAQTAGLFLVPFVKLWVALRGTSGLFFFVRVLFLLFWSGVGWSVYALTRTRLPRHAALLTSALSITFLPHGIPGLSYNTLGAGFLALGLLLVARALVSPPDATPRVYRDRFTWAGFTLAASAFAYPTLVVSSLAATAAVFALASGRRVATAGRMAFGGAVFALLTLPVLVMAGRQHLREMVAYSSAGLVTGDNKVQWMLDESFGKHHEWPLLVVATAMAVAVARRAPRLFAVLLPLLPLLAKGADLKATHTSLGFVTSLALCAPLVALALRDARAARTLIAVVWLPSACAGAAMAWTSSNGFVASGAGLFPAAIVSTILIAMWTDELARSFHTAGLRVVFGFAPLVVLFTMVKMALAADSTYRDGTIPELTARVSEGPFAGLLTTPDRKRWLAKTSADIVARASTSRALFYYDFPAGYLIAAKRPLVPSPWIFFREPATTIDGATFERLARRGDVVFKLGRIEQMDPKANALDRAVQERCDLADGAAEGYSVWVVR